MKYEGRQAFSVYSVARIPCLYTTMNQKGHFLVSLPSVNTRLRRRLIDVRYHVQMVCKQIKI